MKKLIDYISLPFLWVLTIAFFLFVGFLWIIVEVFHLEADPETMKTITGLS